MMRWIWPWSTVSPMLWPSDCKRSNSSLAHHKNLQLVSSSFIWLCSVCFRP